MPKVKKPVVPEYRIGCTTCTRKGRLRMLQRQDGTFVPALPRQWQVKAIVSRILFRCSVCQRQDHR